MELRDVFRAHGLDLAEIAVLFHVSDKPKLHKALPMLAEQEPDLFDAFQNQHGPQVEATLKKRKYIATFVNVGANDYIYSGLFEVRGSRFQTMAELDGDPRRVLLQQRYDDTVFADLGRQTGQAGRLVFALEPRAETVDLIGRLMVAKPVANRNYRFKAENLDCPIVEIARHRQLVPPPPDWREFVVSADELRSLPRDWAARLAGWRGVYLITDARDGARYVGAAYGVENLLGRWRAHVAREKGVTAELGQRSTTAFRFSILQLLLHDADASEVQALEANWKLRLHTREWGLNRN
jgi:GIY-YIG catalytic domain